MKKLIILLLFGIFLISLANAEIESLPPQKINTDIELKQIGADFSACNITSVSYPNSSIIFSDKAMTKRGNEYNYTLTLDYTKVLGKYVVNGFCTNGSDDIVWAYDLEVTPTGEVLTTAKGIIYILLTILIFLLFLFVLYVNIALPMGNEKDNRGQTIKISKKKYIKIALIPVTYSLFLWFLNLLLSISSNLTGKFNIYYEMISFLFLIFLRLSWAVWIVCLVWFIFNWIRDLHWNKQIKKFGRVIG